MPLRTLISMTFSTGLLIGCVNDGRDPEQGHSARVIGKGMDCGDTWLLKISDEEALDDVESVAGVSVERGTYYADGLPEELKAEGGILRVRIRAPSAAESQACTALGPGYAHVKILEAARAGTE